MAASPICIFRRRNNTLKITIRLVLTLAFLAPNICFGAGSATVPDIEFSLAGIELGSSKAEVLTKLGPAQLVTDTGDFLNIQLDYPQLTVWLGEGSRVGELFSTSSKSCTPSGVCPGMCFAEAKKILGEPLVADREDGKFMEYPGAESACWIQMAIVEEVIQSIRIECQP